MIRFMLILVPPLVSCWGGDGHSIITHVASKLVDRRSQGFLAELLGPDYIEAARWADTDEAAAKYPGSKYYHFSNTPYRNCQTFDFFRDCGATPKSRGLCLASGLARFIQVATDISASQEARADAMKFILHLMGDIHQPLHTAFDIDKGGTRINLGHPADTSLHELWDYGLLDAEKGEKHWRDIAEDLHDGIAKRNYAFLDRIAKQQNVGHVVGNGETEALIDYAAYIASETSTNMTCKFAYMDEKFSYIISGAHVSADYYRTRAVYVKLQLAKASARLAILINEIVSTYCSRLLDQRFLARSARVADLFQQSKVVAPGPRDTLAGNSFAPLHDPSSHHAVEAAETNLTGPLRIGIGGAGRTPSRRGKAVVQVSEVAPVNWTSVAEENKAIKSRYLLEGVDLSRIRGYTFESKFFVTYAERSKQRNQRLGYPQSGTIVRSINYYPEFVFFDMAVFTDDLSSELAKRAFLRAKGYDVDAVSNTSAIEVRLGYTDGLILETDIYFAHPIRNQINLGGVGSSRGGIWYSGEKVMDVVPVDYMQNRVGYSNVYNHLIFRFMMHQLERDYAGNYELMYNRNIDLLASKFIMVATSRVSLITLENLWETGDGRVPRTVSDGFYHVFFPSFTEIETPWVLLIDYRIFPGPPPMNPESFLRIIQLTTETRESVQPEREALRWFKAFEEAIYGKNLDRLVTLPALGTVEQFQYPPHVEFGIPTRLIMRVSKTPLSIGLKTAEQEMMMGTPSQSVKSERLSKICIPVSSTALDSVPHVSGKIPFGPSRYTTFESIVLPFKLHPYPSLIAREEEEILTQALLPRPSVVLITEPKSGLVVLVNGTDLLATRDSDARESKRMSFVLFGLQGAYPQRLFNSSQAMVLLDMQLLRDKRKAVSIRIFQDLLAVAELNFGLNNILNRFINSSQFMGDIEWFNGAVIYGNHTTDSNPRWDLHSGQRMASALGAPPFPIYHYLL